MPRGYGIADTKNWTDFKVYDFELKKETDDDVEVAITHCGVCGSDVHTISGGWGPLSHDFCIPGHEIVGTATKVGKNVKGIKVGDRVGVGAQVDSCGECVPCKDEEEQYCQGNEKSGKGLVDTYNANHHCGTPAQGGYSTTIRTQQQFVFPIPDGIKSEHAAPMLCGGLTLFSPLIRNGAGPGKRVGIVGIGGLGHFGVMFAHALGAEVVAISHSPRKKEDALKMGAKEFVSTGENPKWAEEYKSKPFDLIINTASSNAVDLASILSTLKVHGRLICVGMPEDVFKVRIQNFAGNGCLMGSSHIGSKKEALQMLALAAEKNIQPWVEVLPMKDCSKAVKRVEDNDIRYRFVLEQDIEEN
ncbi:Alcohol dehydrogenase, C-terminal [Kalmanozyma brasiliensis GHG001]|uniref:alcohol dehydrogenase (NADP(+)) n=1 Tax=Kalmanozyma brasiliensis (strain GHG001) TaxID=1365824 RepID=V5ERM4_KALBG|nr:Alcohol dehydrogenase, C-terminal [Kalmanozyma brasiliensis GHG001]EST07805.1 Alcohol dehydrogenase, C-terminal [Kalmanozyma brasiliensis GHG001]